MNPTLQCIISIRNAKCDGTAFADWLRTDMGQLGLELVDNDTEKLHELYIECAPIRLH